MSLRPFLLTLGGVLVVAVGACTLNTAGLGSTSGGSEAGAGGAPAATTAATGGEQVGATNATAQSSVAVGTGGADGTSASSGSTAASSSVSSAVSSASASASSSSAASSSSTGGGVTCDSQFGGAASYKLCNGDTKSCEFYVNSANKTSCNEVCAILGGECTAAFDNGASACAHGSGDKGCSAKFSDSICQCSLSCGSNAPCAAGWTCNNGTCIH